MAHRETGRAPVVLMADPGDAYGEVFKPQLSGFRIVSARSVAEVQQIITSGTSGPLAMVSLRFNGSTPAVIQSLKKAGWTRVLALTLAEAPVAPVIEAVNAGASGVLTVAGVVDREPDPLHPAHKLSPREVEVVRLVAEGLTNKAIGQRLSLSALTIKNHLARIGRKLDAGDRAHIVAIACRGGVITRAGGGSRR
ncbi:helix-turn-helix transcriptional regulator [Nakamurella sp. GG22]